MAKLYRIVPNSYCSIMEKEYVTVANEDLLYRLGYLSFADHKVQYYGVYSYGMKSESTEDYMFFFDSPWSCFKCINFFDSLYTDEVATILEYDIPDEIVNVSSKAFTNFENYQAMGHLIPIHLLTNGKNVKSEFSDELKEKLQELVCKDMEEAIQKFCQSVKESKYSKFKYNPNVDFNKLSKVWLNPKTLSKIKARKFRTCGKYFKTEIVTGKMVVITGSDTELVYEVLSQERPINDLNELMSSSNGILTPENFKSWDKCPIVHTYGRTLNY